MLVLIAFFSNTLAFVLQAQHMSAARKQLISGWVTLKLLLLGIISDFSGSRILEFGLTLLSLGFLSMM